MSGFQAHINQAQSGGMFDEIESLAIPSAPSSGERATSSLEQPSSVSSQLFSPSTSSMLRQDMRASNYRVPSRAEIYDGAAFGGDGLRAPTPLNTAGLPLPLQQMLAKAHDDHRRLHEQAVASNLNLGPSRSASRAGMNASSGQFKQRHSRHSSMQVTSNHLSAMRDQMLDNEMRSPLNVNDVPASAPLPSSATFPNLTSNALTVLEQQHGAKLRTAWEQDELPRPPSSAGWGSHQRAPSVDASLAAKTSLQQKRRSLQPSHWSSKHIEDSALHLDDHTRTKEGVSNPDDANQPIALEDFLQSFMEQREKVHRRSLDRQQQQQLQEQQKRQLEQINQTHALASASSTSVNQIPSRSQSRISNFSTSDLRTSGRQRAASRASSVHDAIPMERDDLFSTDSSDNLRALHASHGSSVFEEKETSPMIVDAADLYQMQYLKDAPLASTPPVGEINGGSNPLEERDTNKGTAVASPAGERTETALNSSSDMSASTSRESSKALSPEELEGHREIYKRLRRELSQDDLGKFELYVRRYDHLEIPLDGPRGLLMRVKKLLLLSDTTIRQHPEKLRLRKELAREFERICKMVHE